MKSLLVGFIVCFMQLPLFRVKLYYNVCVWNFPEGRGTTCFPFQSLGLFDISHHRYKTFSYPLLFLTHSNHLHGVFYGIVENFSKFFFSLTDRKYLLYNNSILHNIFAIFSFFFVHSVHSTRFDQYIVRFGSVFVLQLIFCPIIAWNKAI